MAEGGDMVGREVDLVGAAIEREGHGLAGFGIEDRPVEVVDDLFDNSLHRAPECNRARRR